jgi:hypothetical protein
MAIFGLHIELRRDPDQFMAGELLALTPIDSLRHHPYFLSLQHCGLFSDCLCLAKFRSQNNCIIPVYAGHVSMSNLSAMSTWKLDDGCKGRVQEFIYNSDLPAFVA